MRSYFFIIITFLIFTSCADEGAFGFWGVILDSNTNLPIDSVKCELYIKGSIEDIQYSDSLGNFMVDWSGYVYNHINYNPLVVFTKIGYVTQSNYDASDETKTIYLVPVK